ncbi:histone deacetylation protein Rxt3-domain-containing protein [Leucosporidium creatinivorum]|uniref:Histone deacetylation protein Rxt3-domain-containing protein n=1 Tax=Leucosporidium creatinivorum TaxID=106004 RepID=A0A1Y2FNB7_9BASI|nr:histone deacetylation protein Rxt3-domain-containing protein [Leucosporidium creatinivorum]
MAEGQQTNGAAEATPTQQQAPAAATATPATQEAASASAPAPSPLPSMSSAPRPAAQQSAAPPPSAHAGSEKSLFPNSLPVRQSLPSIHSFGAASHSPINAGPYGDSRARSAGTESKGATPNRFSASPSPYNTLPSLSNTSSPKLAAPTSTSSQAAPHTSASPRLPGLSKLSPPAPAAATPPASSASPASSSYRNPMSVSSMLSGPSRDRPYGSVNSTAAASGAGASPQPPVLPPAPTALGGARKEDPKHENGKAASPPLNPAIGGFRRPAEGASATPGRDAGAKSSAQGRPAGGDKPGMSPVGGAAAAAGDKDAAGNSKAERSYPPLPSAFARESPYSTWAGSSKKDAGFGARHDSASSKEGSPPAPQGAPKQAGKTFFPSINNSFSRPPTSTPSHRHSNSVPGQPSFPPTFPWTAATIQQQQQQQAQQQQAQQPQQQASSSVRSYPDFYHTNSTDSLRAQDEKRKAEAASASHHSHSSQSTAQQQQHRQGAAQTHQSSKSHVRYPGSDAYPSLAGRAGTTAAPPHISATQDMPSWRTAESGATSTIPAPLNSSTSAHKRRRSEVAGGHRQEGGFADGQAKVVKKPFVPPFSLSDQRKATVRPPLLSVRNEEVLKALALPSSSSTEADADGKAPKRPFLGRVVYDPFVNPATLLDGQLLRANVGGVVEVCISTGWFEPSPYLSISSSTTTDDAPPSLPSTLYEFGDPATYDGSPLSDPNADESDPRIPPSVWELEGVRKRKVWGSDVYTDDSDVLALLLHSGWLRLGRRKLGGKKLVAGEKGAGDQAVKASRAPWKGFGGEGEGEKKQEGVKSLIVKLVVAPRLVRYQGCERMGIKSRSWGNGHDGVSLMVESVDLVDELLRPHGRRWTKRRLGDLVDSLLPKDVAAPPSTIDVVLPKDGSTTLDDEETLSVVDTFVLGPRKEDCSFVRTELSPVLANGAAAAEAMEVDEV